MKIFKTLLLATGLTALGNTTLTPTTRITTTAAATGAINTEGLTSTIAATTAKPTQSLVDESTKSSKIEPSQFSKSEEFPENDKTQVIENDLMNDKSKDPVKTSTNSDDDGQTDNFDTEEVEPGSLPDLEVEIGNSDNEDHLIISSKDEEKTEESKNGESQMGENVPPSGSTSEISTTTQKIPNSESPEQQTSSTKKSDDFLKSTTTTISYIARDPGSRPIETSSYFDKQVAEPDAASRMLGVVCLGALVIGMIYFIRKSKKEGAAGRTVRYQQLRDLDERQDANGETQVMLNDIKNFDSDSEEERDVWRWK